MSEVAIFCHVRTGILSELHFPEYTMAYKNSHFGLQLPGTTLSLTLTVTQLLTALTWTQSPPYSTQAQRL